MTVDDHRYVVAGLPQGDLARNVRTAGSGELAKSRRRSSVALRVVTDPTERRAVMTAFPTEVPGGVFFFICLGLVATGTPEEFASASDEVAVFELSPS